MKGTRSSGRNYRGWRGVLREWSRSSWLGVFIILPLAGVGELRSEEWARTFGDTELQGGAAVCLISDGDYVVGGFSANPRSGVLDALLVRLDRTGALRWEKRYGSRAASRAQSVVERSGGGFWVFGAFDSFKEKNDYWLSEVRPDGTLANQLILGGNENEEPLAVLPRRDGTILLTGTSWSFGSAWYRFLDEPMADGWLVKLTAANEMMWQRRIGGRYRDEIRAVLALEPDGYVLTGGNSATPVDGFDLSVIEIDGKGEVVWSKAYAGSENDVGRAIAATPDGGFVIAAETRSFGAGFHDVLVLKLDRRGNLQWQRTYGGSGDDVPVAIRSLPGGGFLLAAKTESFGAVAGDLWLLKLNLEGVAQWQQRIGGRGPDHPSALELTPDGGFVVVGSTARDAATIEDVFEKRKPNHDLWIVKFDSIDARPSIGIETDATTGLAGLVPRDFKASSTATNVRIRTVNGGF